ncbi:hypothetical protein Hamer_G013534 [Homarus americanus]|uniref:Uncharacterized protein n=1 Tax=Homarus americanus TaxID=6706 RepID=A0A8J5N0D8_HOMAM|nr:hypothetical protein Hamer_G013534 [Homarus americanus]
MLEEDEKQEEQQPTQEDDIKPGEPTTRQLTELLTNLAHVCEQLEEYDTRPHSRNLMCSSLEKGMEEQKAFYMSLVNDRQQALIIWYLCKTQPVNALANITLGDDNGTTDDDIEVLGDLLVEELPQDFEGLDAESRGGVEEGAGRSSNQPSLPWNPSTSPVKHFTNSIKINITLQHHSDPSYVGKSPQ